MGIMKWFYNSVARASSYGEVIGREAVKNGLVLGRALYLGHGTRPPKIKDQAKENVIQHEQGWVVQCHGNVQVGPFETKEEANRWLSDARCTPVVITDISKTLVYEDSDHMVANGFELYTVDPTDHPPTEDASELSGLTRAAGVVFAASCATTAASNFMKMENAESFNRSVAIIVRSEMCRLDLGIPFGKLDMCVGMSKGVAKITKVLDRNTPGANDLMAVCLTAINIFSSHTEVGFQRRGVLGFHVVAVPLAEETALAIANASHNYRW